MNIQFNYDKISTAYADLVDHDPSKQYVQYPWALAQLPAQINGLRILDIGCGEGSISRLLAKMGAMVFGYDDSSEQIREACLDEEKVPLGITYIHADPSDIVGKISACPAFDIAISVTVLHYAADRAHLDAFFTSTFQLVKPGGFFAALVMNSEYKRYGESRYNRIYRPLPDGRIQADFLDDTGIRCTAEYSDFTRADYEESAALAGWKNFTWCPVKVTVEGKAQLGSFWDGFEEDCPYAGFRVVKPLE